MRLTLLTLHSGKTCIITGGDRSSPNSGVEFDTRARHASFNGRTASTGSRTPPQKGDWFRDAVASEAPASMLPKSADETTPPVRSPSVHHSSRHENEDDGMIFVWDGGATTAIEES